MLLTTSIVVLWVIVGIQAAAIIALVRQFAELRYSAVRGPLPVGSSAPYFIGRSLRPNVMMASSDEIKGTNCVLVFLTPTCGLCREIESMIKHTPSPELDGLIVVCKGEIQECRHRLLDLDEKLTIIVDDRNAVSASFSVTGYPTAVLIDGDWTITGFRFPRSGQEVLGYLAESSGANQTNEQDL